MQTLYIHPITPQERFIEQVADALAQNHAIITPTPFGYGLAVGLSAQKTFDKLTAYIDTPAYLVCRDVSELAKFANLDNGQFATVRTAFKQNTQNPSPIFKLTPTKDSPNFLGKTSIHITFAHDPISIALLDKIQTPFVVLPLDDDTSHNDYETSETHGHLAKMIIAVGEIDKEQRAIHNLI